MLVKTGYLLCLSVRQPKIASIVRLSIAASSAKSSKANLAKLRKKTGFSFVNCRKALEKFDNHVDKAEVWLKEQAQKEGWSKATKLQGRVIAQGLIGVICQDKAAVMVEVNCETDFVARNTKFQHLVGQVATSALGSHQDQDPQNIIKVPLSVDDLKSLKGDDGKTIDHLTALTIGQVGENMSVRRGLLMGVPQQVFIGSYVHSALQKPQQDYPSKCSIGKYGALVAFKKLSKDSSSNFRPDILGRRLSQHIVGMNPLRIGVYNPPDPEDVVAKEDPILMTQAEKWETEEEPPPPAPEPVTDMLNQEYLLDPSIKVGELLLQENVEIVDFARFECGES